MPLSNIRAKLDRLDEQIVARLKDRSWFTLNQAVYQPDAIPIVGRTGISLMEWALEGLEQYHASLGRYDIPDQHPILYRHDRPSPVQRHVTQAHLPVIEAPPRDQLIQFYTSLLPKLCRPGDEPHYYGETVYTDADLLSRLNERIYLGAFIAYSKLQIKPSILALAMDPQRLRAALRDAEREHTVLQRVKRSAQRYDVPLNVTVQLFRWIIEQTLDLEVRFIQRIAGTGSEPVDSSTSASNDIHS